MHKVSEARVMRALGMLSVIAPAFLQTAKKSDRRWALSVKAFGLVKHDRVLNRQPLYK